MVFFNKNDRNMTSFGWKRKSNLKTSSAAVFDGEGEEKAEAEAWEKEGVDWLTAAKRRKLILLEDNIIKSKRRVPPKNQACYIAMMMCS